MPSPAPSRVPPRLRRELLAWLNQWPFTHFVTLATNAPELSEKLRPLTDLVRKWDARMNREIVGPKWAQPDYRDARMFAFYFLEKPRVNPHWHALIRLNEPDLTKRTEKHKKIEDLAELHWTELVASGTVDVKIISRQTTLTQYVAKELGHEVSYQHFLTPDEFERR